MQPRSVVPRAPTGYFLTTKMHAVRALQSALALLCVCVALVHGASYNIKGARLSVQSFDGSPRLCEQYASKDDVSAKKLVAEPDDVVRFSFTITDGAGVQVSGDRIPQQVWVVLADADRTSETRSFVWPLPVRASAASASYHLRMDKLSAEMRQALAEAGAHHGFKLTLLIGGFAPNAASELEPLALPFLDLEFSESMLSRFSNDLVSARARAEAEDGFRPWPKHAHTFAVEPWRTMPPSIVSLVIALGVAAGPWVLLCALWKPLVKRVLSPALPETLLLTCVYGLEVLAVLHWIGAPFFIVAPTALALSSGALLSGRQALVRTFVS